MNNHEIKSSALQPGFLIGGGRYTLARIVEVRAASELWVALDNQLGEEVALRVFSRAISSDPGVASKLRQAAQRSRKLSHPNIARVFDFVETPGEAAVIAMERIEAANLGESRLNRPGQVMSWSELEPIVLQVAEALDYAWNEGVAWGNLRPWNLLVDGRGRVKLLEFGLPPVAVERTESGPESLPYESPQLLDGGAPGVADDIYALGVTIYELLCGSTPFEEGDLRYQIRNVCPQHLVERLVERGVANEVPERISALVMACMSKAPEQRPPDGASIVERINRAEPQAPEPISLIPPASHDSRRAGQRATAVEEAEAFERSLPDEPSEEPSAARRWPAVAVAGVILLVAGFIWRANSRESQSAEKAETATIGSTNAAAVTTNQPAPLAPERIVREVWSTPEQSGGLDAILAEDGQFTVVEQGGRQYWKIPRRAHLYLGVDDTLREEIGNRVEIILEYRNTGSGDIRLHYDSLDGTWPDDGAFKEYPTFINRMNTGQWRTMIYEIADARFEKRQNQGADLRFYNNGDPLLIRRVSIRPIAQ